MMHEVEWEIGWLLFRSGVWLFLLSSCIQTSQLGYFSIVHQLISFTSDGTLLCAAGYNDGAVRIFSVKPRMKRFGKYVCTHVCTHTRAHTHIQTHTHITTR